MLAANHCSIISTDEDPGLRIESFAIIKLRGVTTKCKKIFFHHANFQRTNCNKLFVICCVFLDDHKDRELCRRARVVYLERRI